jgi:hypothetical protein
MPVLEHYRVAENVEPRSCEEAANMQNCKAEVIVHRENGKSFLCVKHAAKLLQKHPDMLARAVVEIFIGRG